MLMLIFDGELLIRKADDFAGAAGGTGALLVASGAAVDDIIQTVAFNVSGAFSQHIIKVDGGSSGGLF